MSKYQKEDQVGVKRVGNVKCNGNASLKTDKRPVTSAGNVFILFFLNIKLLTCLKF